MQNYKWYEFTEYIAPDGDKYRFNAHDKFIVSEEGFGMPEIEYITQSSPMQHGESVIDYRLQPRMIQYVVARGRCSRDDYWAARANILNILRPNRQTIGQVLPGVLRRVLSNGNVRAIDVFIQEGPAFNKTGGQWYEHGFVETLRFFAPDPTFYDPTCITEIFALGATTSNLVFPFTFPFIFGTGIVNTTSSITYNGTWLSYPTILLTGPMIGARIENTTTGEAIKINYTIPAGDVVTIDLAFGVKTITDNHGVDLIGTVDENTNDIATFHLEPDPGATGGVNAFSFFTSGATANTAVSIAYHTRYIGI